MVKLNSEMKAGTDSATVTDVEVNHVSQTIAKPNVVCSQLEITNYSVKIKTNYNGY